MSHKLTARQLGSILFLQRALPVTLTFPMMIGMQSSHGLWIAGALGTLISLPLLVWMASLSRAEGLDDIIQISRRRLGTTVGGAVGWLFVFYWMLLAALQVRSVGEAYVIGTMPETPIVVFMVLTALVSSGIARRGIKLIAMMSELTAALILLGLLLTFILPADAMQFRNLLPLLPEDLSSLALPTGTAVSLFLDLNVLMMIAPYMKSSRDLMRGTVYSALISGAILILLVVVVTAVFGPLATSLELPALSLTRMISLGEFFERLELITVASWTSGAGLVLSTSLWAAAEASANLLGLKRYEPLVYPLGGLAVIMGLGMWPNMGAFDRSASAKSGSLVTAVFVIAVLVVLTGARWLNRRKGEGPGGTRMIAAILALGLTAFLATGCWSHREIESLGFVNAVGVDTALGKTHWELPGEERDPGELIQVTAHVVKPSAIVSGERGPAPEKPFWVISATGYTIFEAVRNVSELSPRRLSWPHSRWVLFGEEFAKGGVARAVDFLVRDQETRRRAVLGVASGARAWDLLQSEFELERVPGEAGMGIAMNASKSTSTIVIASVNDFVMALESEGIDPIALRIEVMPYMYPYEITGDVTREQIKSVARLTGAAVFRSDKLVGWLDGREARGYNWITGKTKSGILVIDAPELSLGRASLGSRVGLEIIRSSGSFRPKIEDNGRTIGIVIKIKAEANISDVQPYVDLYAHPGLWESMERLMAKAIEDEIMAAVKKAQDLRADVFGFGREIHRTRPKLWKEIRDGWYDIFAEIEPEIEIEATLVRSGLTVRSVKLNEMGGSGGQQ